MKSPFSTLTVATFFCCVLIAAAEIFECQFAKSLNIGSSSNGSSTETEKNDSCTFNAVQIDANMVVDFVLQPPTTLMTGSRTTDADIKIVAFHNSTVDLTSDELMDRLCDKFINLQSVTLPSTEVRFCHSVAAAVVSSSTTVKVIRFDDDTDWMPATKDGGQKDSTVHEKLDILLLGMVCIVGMLIIGGTVAVIRMVIQRQATQTEFVWRDYNYEL